MLRKTLNNSFNIRKCTFCMKCFDQTPKIFEKHYDITKISANNNYQRNFITNRRTISIGQFKMVKAKKDIPIVIIDEDLGPLPLVGVQKEIFLVSTIHHRLGFTPEETKKILRKYPGIRYHTSVTITKLFNLLADNNIRNNVIIENLWLLTREYDSTKVKLDIMNEIVPKPNGDINDFVPLLNTTIPCLNLINEAAKKDLDIPGGHRLYFISDKLKINPRIIAESLKKHLYIFRMKFKSLEEILQLQLDNNIIPTDVIRYWTPFRYSPNELKHRLNVIKSSNYPKIKPWLMIVDMKSFDRALIRSKTEADVLNGRNVVEFLADRLGFDIDFTANMLRKFPISYNPRASTLIKTIDYLLNEAGYTPMDIAQCSRILFHSLDKTKARLNELNDLGYVPMSLITVCRSATEYRKTVERIKRKMTKNKMGKNKMGKVKLKQ